MTRVARDLANSHTLCESVNVTMKTTINFYDMTILFKTQNILNQKKIAKKEFLINEARLLS